LGQWLQQHTFNSFRESDNYILFTHAANRKLKIEGSVQKGKSGGRVALREDREVKMEVNTAPKGLPPIIKLFLQCPSQSYGEKRESRRKKTGAKGGKSFRRKKMDTDIEGESKKRNRK